MSSPTYDSVFVSGGAGFLGSHLLPRLLGPAGAKRVVVFGDGSQSKSYIHVEDVLNAVFLADACATVKFDVFNVATGDYITVREIAELATQVCGVMGVKFEFTGGDRGWKGDVPIVRFDCAKIHSLGWRCQRTSAQAMHDSIASMREEIASS